jgi:hypothetical protein
MKRIPKEIRVCGLDSCSTGQVPVVASVYALKDFRAL